ncbi:hypothetical protein ACOKM5_23295 [Streptomyces sp. BH097]|uniref:hypothetical protein n=1 Tax=unclassified Streptomyces TaxID=2593676 RepID=UPI003BB6B513
MTNRTLPHDPYINSVVDALTAANLGPDDYWTSDAETDPYDNGPDAGCTTMLSAYLDWDTADAHEHGIALMWEHPAEQWQWAPRHRDGHLEREPEFLPMLGRYAQPASVVAVVSALLAGDPLPDGHAPYWHEADPIRVAVKAWAEDESSQ